MSLNEIFTKGRNANPKRYAYTTLSLLSGPHAL
jgi:hypothetical protein